MCGEKVERAVFEEVEEEEKVRRAGGRGRRNEREEDAKIKSRFRTKNMRGREN